MTNLQLALRGFRRQPLFSAMVVLTLALGIGATTALYSVVDAVLLRPLPFPRAERLIHLWQSNFDQGLPRFAVSPPDYLEIAAQAHSFSGLAASHRSDMSLTGTEDPVRLLGARVSSGYFRVLGSTMVLGRSFADDEDQPGAEPVMILADSLWRSRFGGDPDVIGKRLRLDGVSRTVVGVAPTGSFLDREVWVPLVLENAAEERGSHYLSVVGRLAPGARLDGARQEVQTIAAQLEHDFPGLNTGWSADLEPLREAMAGELRPALYALLAAVAAVLLIACLNVAHLLLVRLAGREREMAVRSALGATPGTLVGQLLVECAVLAVSAGLLGTALAAWGTPALLALDPAALPRAVKVAVDGRVLFAGLALSLSTTVIFGLIPALRSARPDLVEPLKEGGRGQAGGGEWLRRSLVLAEVALAVALVAGGGLLLKSFNRLSSVEAGFEPESVLTVSLAPSRADFPEPEAIRQLTRRLYERLGVGTDHANLPGVETAAAAAPLPYSGRGMVLAFTIAGTPPPAPGQEPITRACMVSPGFFRTMRIPLVAGRSFELSDDDRAAGVVIVSEAAAARFWPDQSPLGQRISFEDPTDPEARWLEVVGVVGDLRPEQPGESPEPFFYQPSLQQPILNTTLLLRTTGSFATAADAVRGAVREVDPQIPLFDLRPMGQVLSSVLAQPRFNATLLALFAALALVLAATGVYGVTSYSIGQRRREIGIRAALGADRRTLLRWVVRLGMTPVVLGLAFGVLLALLAGKLLQGLVFGTGVHDPRVLGGAVVVLGLVALLACWLPASRAAAVDPGEALREE